MRTPKARLKQDKTKRNKRLDGYLQAPRVLRGIERWSKLWFVLYRDVSNYFYYYYYFFFFFSSPFFPFFPPPFFSSSFFFKFNFFLI